MNHDRLLTFVVAIVCVGAVGLSATTLDDALETHPDDVVELEYERLPIGKNDTESISQEIESNRNNGQSAGVAGDAPGQEPTGVGDSGDPRTASPDDGSGPLAGGSEVGGGGGGSSGDSTGVGTGTWSHQSLIERLLDLLVDLLPMGLLLAGLALAYRYRHRLVALVCRISPRDRHPEDQSTSHPPRWTAVEPSNEVHRAWLAMIRSLPIDRPWTLTPAECAAIAHDTGVDPAAVDRLTRTFEEVRYGDRPVTDRRRQIARESRRLFEGGTG